MTLRTAPAAATLPLPRNRLPENPGHHGGWQGSPWVSAKSVLVTRPVAPGAIATSPHLVIPAERGLGFLLSSCGVEAEQLALDPRVVIQPGDWRGRPTVGSRQQYGTVRIFSDHYLAERVHNEMRIKYPTRTALARMAHRFEHGTASYGDLVAFVEVHPPRPLMIGQ